MLNLFILYDLSATFDPRITGNLPSALDLWVTWSLSWAWSSHYSQSLTRTRSLCALADYDSRLSVVMKDDNSDYNIINQTMMRYNKVTQTKCLEINEINEIWSYYQATLLKIYLWLKSARHWIIRLLCLTLILCYM